MKRLLAIYCALFSGLLDAATPIPQNFEPGQIERQIGGQPDFSAVKPTPVISDVAKVPDTLTGETFVLAGVLVEGATVYSNVEFLAFYQALLGKKVTVGEVRKVADDITRHYKTHGYFLSSAFLPAQSIEYGVVRIRVVEGHIDRWQIKDSGGRVDPLVQGILRPVLAQKPLQKSKLEHAFRTLSALPGLSLRPDVRPIPGQLGAYALTLEAKQKSFDGSVSFDNRGSEYIGPFQGVATIRAYDLMGHHESYQLSVATAAPTSELHYVDLGTDWILGPSGLRLQGNVSHTVSKPGGSLRFQQARVVNERQQIGLAYPLWQSAVESHWLSAFLGHYHSQTELSGAKRLEDRLTSLNISYRRNWQQRSSTAQTVGVSIGQGLKLESSKVVDTQATSGVGRVDYTKLSVNYGLNHKLTESLFITALVDAQYAATELPTSERYSLGGAQFGRAYDPSEISGDHGLAVRLELSGPSFGQANSWRLAPYGYYDAGAVWQIKPAANTHARNSLASLGLGIRAGYSGFDTFVEVSKPLTRSVSSQGRDGKDARIFAGGSYSF
ncbi:MAG TPA: ShlB/FhaC/HecB family hemolysin secretion/activation protein [Thiobacillus sp.]